MTSTAVQEFVDAIAKLVLATEALAISLPQAVARARVLPAYDAETIGMTVVGCTAGALDATTQARMLALIEAHARAHHCTDGRLLLYVGRAYLTSATESLSLRLDCALFTLARDTGLALLNEATSDEETDEAKLLLSALHLEPWLPDPANDDYELRMAEAYSLADAHFGARNDWKLPSTTAVDRDHGCSRRR